MVMERTSKLYVKVPRRLAVYAKELEKQGTSPSALLTECLIERQMAEGYKAMGTEDIELAEQFLSISQDVIPHWETRK